MKKNEWMKRELTEEEKKKRGATRILHVGLWHGIGLGRIKGYVRRPPEKKS